MRQHDSWGCLLGNAHLHVIYWVPQESVYGQCKVSTWPHHAWHMNPCEPARGLPHHFSNNGFGSGTKTSCAVIVQLCVPSVRTYNAHASPMLKLVMENVCPCQTHCTVFHRQIFLVKTVCPKLHPISLLHVFKLAGLPQLPWHDIHDQNLEKHSMPKLAGWFNCLAMPTALMLLYMSAESSPLESVNRRSWSRSHRFTQVMVPSRNGRLNVPKSANMTVAPYGIFSKMRRHFMTTMAGFFGFFFERTGAGKGSKTLSFKKPHAKIDMWYNDREYQQTWFHQNKTNHAWCKYIYIYINTYIHTYVHIYKYTYTHVYIYAYIHLYIYLNI